MRSILLSGALALLTMFSTAPARADWALSQGNGSAAMSQQAGPVKITFFCTRSRPDQLQISFDPWPQPARGAMIWITLPDGRNDRQPMDVMARDRALSVTLMTSSLGLEHLQQAASLVFDIDNREIARTDAKGTGAFRLAVLEQCGF